MEGAVGIQGSNASTERESENTENQKEANTSNENKIQIERLVDDLKLMIDAPVPPLSTGCRIRRIPDDLRQVKEKAYTPTTISIGPIHRCKNKFQIMETCKVRYFKSFISRTKINLEELVSTISNMEQRIRSCYVEATCPVMQSDEFVKMILVDAVFILELFYRDSENDWEKGDLILPDQITNIRCDLILLENQLPFFVLKKLFDLISPPLPNSFSFIYLTFKFFDEFNVQKRIPQEQIEHFTDLLRTFQIPQRIYRPERQTSTEKVTLLYSATQLHEAGVKFKVISRECLDDSMFKFTNGVLEIPVLELYDETETLIRNVMALEEFRYPTEKYVTDYFIVLDDLINTTKDMDLLCNEKIVINHLGDNNAATSFFNNLNTNILLPGVDSNYNHICQNLNKFCEKRWHRWKATLRHQYFSTPWRIASTIAAIILLVFTFIQTDSSSGNLRNASRWKNHQVGELNNKQTLQLTIVSTRVPYYIRSVNPQAYTPMVISIGPFHHFNENLEIMEMHKAAFLRDFIARVEIELDKFESIIKEMEETIRCCYAETSTRSMSSDDFVKMILQDAIFILELFLRYSTGIWDRDRPGDPVLTSQRTVPLLKRDLVLLENQLPFIVLEKLYNRALDSNSPSLIQLTFEFFNDYNVQTMSPDNVEIQHFTELMRTFQLPLRPSRRKPPNSNSDG